jgi:hypothetical protein
MNYKIRNSWLALIVLSTLTLNCGKKDKKKESPDPSPPFELDQSPVGSWVGVFQKLEDEESSGEAVTASVVIEANKRFMIELGDSPKFKTEGTWSEFQSQKLILKLTSSTANDIGAQGQIIEVDYRIRPTQLALYHSNFEMYLNREESGEPGDENQDVPAKFFIGRWTCDNDAGRTSIVSIDSNNDFKLSTVQSGEQILVVIGNAANTSPERLSLNIKESSATLAKGAQFELQKTGQGARLYFNRPNTGSLSLGSCRK